jgi:hypothetical protein
LPDIPIEAGTGYWNTSTTDIPIIEVSADQGTSWVPRYAHEAIVASITSALDGSAALGLITGIQTVVNDLNASLGQPGGIATLDENGILVQVAGLIVMGQNDDGTYNARPAVPWPIIWVMRVPGTNLPDNDGSILGGGGIVEGLDYAVDLTISLGG